MNSTEAADYTATTTYPACYEAARAAYAAGADDDTAYQAAKDAAADCTRRANGNAAMCAMNAAYDATMAARADSAA
jgi:hypothetical protein